MGATGDLARVREKARDGTAREIRERARVSQGEIADELGVHWTTVARWETGQRAPRGELARRYARLLRELEKVGDR